MANYYINATGQQGTGDGSSAGNAANASTGALYSSIVRAQTSSGTTIVYSAGTYVANSLQLPMPNGVTHQGAGIDQTIIRVANGTINPGNWLPIFYGSNGTMTGWKIFDITFDFNSVNQPALGSTGGLFTCATAFSTATNCTVQRCKFINFGSNNQESFLVYFNHGNSTAGT